MALALPWFMFIVLPLMITMDYSKINETTEGQNIFDGKGSLGETWMFYGNYPQQLPESGYNIALAYFVLILISYYGVLFVIITKIALLTSEKSGTQWVMRKAPFCYVMFTQFDYAINSTEGYAQMVASMEGRFKELLDADHNNEFRLQLNKKEKLVLYAKRALAWVLAASMIAGAVVLIAKLISWKMEKKTEENEGEQQSQFITVYGTTIAYVLLNLIVPELIKLLPNIENYKNPRQILNITIARTFVLRLANLLCIVIGIYNQVQSGDFIGCSGTMIGQELYKILLLDTFIQSVGPFAISFIKYFKTKNKVPFELGRCVLITVYFQTLIWAGAICCPILPVIGLVSQVIYFICNYVVVKFTALAPKHRWNESGHNVLFYVILAINMIILIVPVSLLIGQEGIINLGTTNVAGEFCGPYKDEQPVTMITNWLESISDNVVRQVLLLCFSSTVQVPFSVVLLLTIWYMKLRQYKQNKKKRKLQAALERELMLNMRITRKLANLQAMKRMFELRGAIMGKIMEARQRAQSVVLSAEKNPTEDGATPLGTAGIITMLNNQAKKRRSTQQRSSEGGRVRHSRSRSSATRPARRSRPVSRRGSNSSNGSHFRA